VDEKASHRPVPRAALAVLVVLLATHLLNALGALGLSEPASETLYLLIMVGSAGLCAMRALRIPDERAPWLVLATSIGLWTAGDLLYLALYGLNGTPPFPNVTDGLYLVTYACQYVGIVMLLSSRLRPFRRSRWLDGLVAGLTIAAFTAAFVFKAVLISTEGDPLTVAVTLGYTAADLLLLCFVGVAFALTSWRPDRTWSRIAASFILTAVADALYAYAASSDAYIAGRITDTLWAASALSLATAAWQGKGTAGHRSDDDSMAIVMPAMFALSALGLLICGWFLGLPPIAGILATLGLLAGVARARLTFAENLKYLRSSRGEALTDALSGLGNRRLLLQELDAAFGEQGRRHTLVFFDLDGFKHYNDEFGHVAGDALLTRLARTLATSVEGRGSAYRLGGDEFCVLLDPPVAPDDPLIAAAARSLEEHGEAFSVAASYGIAQLPSEADSPERAVALADARMYSHKDSRRGAGKHQAHDALVQVLMEREPELHEHLREVALLAQHTAIELGLRSDELDEVVRAAELHDVGKIAVPDSVLHKPGPLDEGEWQIMRQHPVIGDRILARVPALRSVGALVRSSHERWDGSGYPDRLRGADIPLGARIVAVCDAYDAMTSQRPYAVPRSPESAIAELRRCSGTQFDPAVVDAFSVAHTDSSARPARVLADDAVLDVRHPRGGDDLDGFEDGIADVLEQPLARAQDDRNDVQVELVEQPRREVLPHRACAAGD
jgi:two-component system cell cycle response regulator